MTPSREKELLQQMEGAWCCRLPWEGTLGGSPLRHRDENPPLPPQRHEISPWVLVPARGEGDEALSGGLQRFWGRDQAAELDLSPWVGGDMSLLITLSPVPLLRLPMQLVCPFFKCAVVGLFPQLDPAWEGA